MVLISILPENNAFPKLSYDCDVGVRWTSRLATIKAPVLWHVVALYEAQRGAQRSRRFSVHSSAIVKLFHSLKPNANRSW